MKLSKMRKKARAAFNFPRRVIQWAQVLGSAVTVPVVYIRGRRFTIPQAAVQRD